MSEGFEARITALGLLDKVLSQKQSFDTLLERDAMFKALSPRDRAFVHMLMATTLRNLGAVDDLIKRLQDKPKSSMQPALQNILRIGLVQLQHMHVADHAAVNTSVELCEKNGFPKAKNFVNALLRRFLREKDLLISKHDPVRLNIPEWLLKPLIQDWGLSKAAEIGEALLSEAPLDITIKNPGMLEHWLKQLGAQHLFHNTIRLKEGGSVPSLSGYNDGHWWVQDAAAALPVAIIGDVQDKVVYDLCAAPGGKTAQLISVGAKVTALDRSAKRLGRLKENMQRLSFEDKIETVVTDAAEWNPSALADVILLDAPCSASGIIRRHPDILHLKTSADIESLKKTQSRILDHAANLVKSGGMMIYCTCSILKSEGEAQIEAFLETHTDFQRRPIQKEELAGHGEFLNEHGDMRLFPNMLGDIGGIDGFYVARLVKR